MIIRALSAIDDLLFTRLGFSHRVMWLASVGFGMCAGLGIYTFLYANGLSYVSNDPVVCANCHVMQPYYSGWVKNSHHTVAVCNDCHTPHDFIGKYITKASNGFHHSMAFTLQNFNDPIRIREKNARIVEDNCLRCHEEMVAGLVEHAGMRGEGPHCVRCHGGIGHGID